MTLVRYDWTLANRDSTLVPRVDVLEQPGHYLVRADLPGVAASEIEITTHDGVLTIRAARKEERLDAARVLGRLERAAGTFLRRFTLPEDADAEAISARSANGVLELTITKQAKPQPRRIAIEAA